nr:hypothetical protein CFP56_09679 [Quercus suber]
MNANTATREQFTSSLVDRPLPSNAAQEWKTRAEKLQALLKKLAFHDAMSANLQQTYMTPAASKNKVYFMWDFIGRTLGMQFSVPESLQGLSSPQQETWNDVVGRSVMGAGLILDEKPGMLAQMMQMSYPGVVDVAFGEDVLQLARALKNVRSSQPSQT